MMEIGGRVCAYRSMISLFERSEGDCKDGAVMRGRHMSGNVRTQEKAKRLTGKENKAEGESLKVLGWVSPIAGVGLGGGISVGQGKGNHSFFYSFRHVGEIADIGGQSPHRPNSILSYFRYIPLYFSSPPCGLLVVVASRFDHDPSRAPPRVHLYPPPFSILFTTNDSRLTSTQSSATLLIPPPQVI